VSDFVDTNVFIRLLTRDDLAKAQRCAALFRRARQGTARLVTSESVVAEIVYVLSSRATYQMARADIVTLLRPLLRIRSLRLEHKRSVLRALDRYATSSLDFEDSSPSSTFSEAACLACTATTVASIVSARYGEWNPETRNPDEATIKCVALHSASRRNRRA
jgi:predicted nucleic-acid-binding protein